jgi:hypothetical protein
MHYWKLPVHRSLIISLAGLFAMFVCLLSTTPLAASNISQSSFAQATYLPLVMYLPETSFGLSMTSVTPARGLDNVVATGTTWLRSNSLLWSAVEPVEGGGYRWDAPSVQLVEQDMLGASQNNFKLIVIVRGSPRWATAPYQSDCAPINPSKYQRFAAFLATAVAKYSKPPYNVEYWEIGNEPDATLFPVDSGFGCWGITSDPYYGGRAYGEMLNAVYPAMKAVNPQIKILNGGLLLDHPYDPNDGRDQSGRFIEGMFIAGASRSFDVLSFHSYSYYNGTVDGTRGATDWKVSYLRNLMSVYGVAQKPMLNSEAGLLCSVLTPACREAQADALGRFYIRALGDKLLGHIWYIYDSDEFNNTALVEPSNVVILRPSYYVYRYASTILAGAAYLGPLSGQPAGVEGYRFSKGPRAITIFWSDSSQTVTIPVTPGATVSCIARDGTAIACQVVNGGVTLQAQPGLTYVIQQPVSASS